MASQRDHIETVIRIDHATGEIEIWSCFPAMMRNLRRTGKLKFEVRTPTKPKDVQGFFTCHEKHMRVKFVSKEESEASKARLAKLQNRR